MFIDINTIGPEGLAFERSLSLDGLEGPSREAIPSLIARLVGTVAPAGRGADLRARLEATVPLTCSRCLETFPWSVQSTFELAVVRQDADGAAKSEGSDDAADTVMAPEGKIVLEDIAKEQLYLSLPLKPICTPACQGLCPACGANRNLGECGCTSDDVDPRLAPLLPFRRKMQGS
jgi:uncharacterized protein